MMDPLLVNVAEEHHIDASVIEKILQVWCVASN